MRLHFLGGADEVGASCLLVEAAGQRILVDAGVRMGAGSGDRLPDLARATELGGLDAVLLTHAHLDHSGALPLVHGAFPGAPVLCTEATLGLLRVLLLDAVKVMQLKSEREDELPLYPAPAVEALLARSRGVRPLETVELPGGSKGSIRATFFPAGHVLGAAAVGLETPEGNLLVSGDVSLTDQRTVAGMARPRFRPDAVVCESTYGARLHASRRAEEGRLATAVLEVLREGGKVLVPAFALGRAQEVLLVLRSALAAEGAPRTVVHYDGMVRAVCAIYGQYPAYLQRTLRERAVAGRGLFHTADGRIRAVTSPAERESILDGPPCAIVSSSGMLSGGPSTYYAARLAGDPSALIAITGYQDEEAPGRRLQEVASGERDELALQGGAIKVACRVATYGLSAHADGQELAGLIAALAPREVALVHGDGPARRELAGLIAQHGLQSVHLPLAGDVLELGAARRRRGAGHRVTGIGAGRPLEREGLTELHGRLAGGPGRSYSLHELAELWHGSESVPVDLSPLRERVEASPELFAPDLRRPFLYRPVREEAPSAAAAGPPRDEAGRLEQNAALALADELLGSGCGLYRAGADRERFALRLYFSFPDVAQHRHAERIAELAERSGWRVEVHPEPQLAALEREVLALLGPGLKPQKAPSVFRDERRVEVVLAGPPDEQRRWELAVRLEETTGFTLTFGDPPPGTPRARQVFDADGRMEINLAFAEIDAAFAGQPVRPEKKSKKAGPEGPLIELGFIAPEIGERSRPLIDELARRTGWPIRVSDRVNQQAVLQAARELLPEGCAPRKGPGLDLSSRVVRITWAEPPPDAVLAEISRKLEQRTGFRLG